MKHHSPKLIFEMIFDIAYLLFALVSGCYLVSTASSYSSPRFLYGIMTLVLGFGDSFHLIPRIIQAIRNSSKGLEKMLGYGKMITSITMTFFYGILFLIWKKQYPQLTVSMLFSVVLLLLIIIRVLLCLCPQNGWGKPTTDIHWSIYRNIPFFLIGLFISILYGYSGIQYKDALFYMPVAIFLSFGFYLPVAVYVHKKPILGMLMIPKTLSYVWIISMGFHLS